MALDEEQVSAVPIGRGVKKVLEADVVERRRGLEARDMAAELRGLLVGAQDDRQGIPPDERPDAVVEDQFLRVQPVFLIGRDGVRYGVVALYGTGAPLRRASSITSSSRKDARSAPSNAITESSASNHSRVSAGSRSSSMGIPPSTARTRAAPEPSTVIVPPAATIRYVPKTGRRPLRRRSTHRRVQRARRHGGVRWAESGRCGRAGGQVDPACGTSCGGAVPGCACRENMTVGLLAADAGG
jgi:hypothetical protein